MPVGQQTTQAGVNGALTTLALGLRELMNDVLQQQGYANKLGAAGLQGLGFTSAEATQVIDDLNHMATIAGCYKGTVQQGGTGGTGAVLFNFDDFLTHLWAGQ